MAKTENTALAVLEEYRLPAVNGEMAVAMEEEMDGLSVRFDRVKIPSGGGVAFEVPGDDPESPDIVKELCGIIVDHYPINAWWEKEYDGSKNPPDCSSLDGRVGIDKATGEKIMCASCPKNQWGSNRRGGNGKDCKNMRRIYLMQEDSPFPLLLALPPTSLQNFSDYISKRVVGKGRRSYGVVTKITLKKDTNTDGIVYSKAVPVVGAILNNALRDKMAEYAASIKPFTRTLEITADEYSVSEDATTTAEDDVM